jgi:hypothetical protein
LTLLLVCQAEQEEVFHREQVKTPMWPVAAAVMAQQDRQQVPLELLDRVIVAVTVLLEPVQQTTTAAVADQVEQDKQDR